MKVRKFEEDAPGIPKSSHINKETDGVRRRKRNRSTSMSVNRAVDHGLERMDQVEGDLEDMYKKRSVTDQRQTIHAIHR